MLINFYANVMIINVNEKMKNKIKFISIKRLLNLTKVGDPTFNHRSHINSFKYPANLFTRFFKADVKIQLAVALFFLF